MTLYSLIFFDGACLAERALIRFERDQDAIDMAEGLLIRRLDHDRAELWRGIRKVWAVAADTLRARSPDSPVLHEMRAAPRPQGG